MLFGGLKVASQPARCSIAFTVSQKLCDGAKLYSEGDSITSEQQAEGLDANGIPAELAAKGILRRARPRQTPFLKKGAGFSGPLIYPPSMNLLDQEAATH